MSIPDLEEEDARVERELRINRQIALTSGLFQDDVTVRTILESLAEGIVIVGDSGTILLANTRIEQMFGYSKKDLVGNPLAVLVPERLRKLYEEHQAHFFAEPRMIPMVQAPDLVGLRRDGSEFPLEISLGFLETINGVLALVFVSDIAIGKQWETEIQDAREYAENIVETLREPLVVLDSDLKILTANHSFYDTFKVTPEETIGNFIYDLGNRQWDIPGLRVLFEEILPQDTVFNGYEVEHDFLDIGRKVILLNARQIFRENIGSHIILLAMEDITQRKQLEAEIQDAREYAENIVETVREPLVVLDSDLKVLTANHSFYDTFKVAPEGTIGNFIYDLGNRQWDIPGLRVLFEEILPQDTLFNGYEVEHDFLDIGRKVILLNARQIFRENIGSHIILLAMEDITERKQLEAEIQDAREYAENIVETVREPLVVLNSDLKVLTANLSFYETFKVAPEGTIGNFIYDLGNRQWDIPGLRVLIEDILPQDTVFNGYEVEHDFVDIGRKVILLNARQIFRENIGSHIILLAMEDITQRKQLEAEIQDAREYAENIVETVREPLVVLNSDLKVLTANHSFYDTFKVTPEETIGNFIYDVGNRQWDIPGLRVLLEEILPQDTVFNGYEVEHDFLDIGRKIILLNARQIFRENIGSHIILLAMEDITERKRLEAEIQDAREYAENIVETVREPLVVLNSDLQVLTANHSFYETFKVTPEETIGNFIYDVGNRQWDIPQLRVLLEEILPQDTVFNGYEVEHDFLDIGRKIILLNARQIFRENIGSHIILLAMEDITERKRLEVEIQDAREYAENIVETVREPLVVLNSDLKVLTANHSFYDTFKVSHEGTIGNFIYDLGNRQWDIPKLRVLIEEILPQDTVFNGYEVEHDFLDIGRKIILLNARQIFRANIGSNIILLAMEDITERKRVEEALARSRAELEESKKLSDALNEIDTVLFSTKDYDVIMNRMLQLSTEAIGAETGVIFSKELGGWAVRYEYKLPQLVVGQNFSNTEVMHTVITAGTKRSLVVQDVANSADVDQKFVEMLGIRSLLDFPLILKGEVIGDLTFHYHSGPVPFNERQVEFVRKLQISITLALENDKLLHTAQQSESNLKEAEKLSKFGNFNYDIPSRKITWSEGVFHIFGRDPIIGEPTVEELFALYSFEPRPEKVRKLVGTKEKSEFDARINLGDITSVLHFVVRSMKDANGDVAAFFGTIQDITERKRGEDILRESEERFHATAVELQTVNKELEAFNYTVAHDLRQPLNIINGYCQAIEKLCGEQLEEECRGYLREAYNGTLRMNRLIDALLNFSRMGRVEPHREMVDLSMLAHEAAKALRLNEPERQVDFRIADGIVANGDASLLRVVLDNLLGNAYKYTVMRERAVIEVGVDNVGGVPIYFVRDNGAGFDMADADKLFTPFQRLPGVEKQKGFGIGLATVERIIQRHGGRLWAEGEPDKGACIYFTLSDS